MGKERSKNFRDIIRKSAEIHPKGKDGTRKRSESEILAMYYSEQDIKRGEKRIEKRIAKRKKQEGKKYPEKEETVQRDYFYVRVIPERGRTNYLGITEEDYNNPHFLGYKAKMMSSELIEHAIQIEHKGDYTDEEKSILREIKREQENLKKMQAAFKDEDTER